MWWHKKPEIVECKTCRHQVRKSYCKKVICQAGAYYVCPMHWVRYDRVETVYSFSDEQWRPEGLSYWVTRDVRVNADGSDYVAPKPAKKGEKKK